MIGPGSGRWLWVQNPTKKALADRLDLVPDGGFGQQKTPAAQYVRMSTDHQNYSTVNQQAAIAEYAARRGFEIIQTYADEGKSGLRLEGREALLDLLEDVQTRRAQYKAILVYDISRWGRFQDADEAAFLEYTCKRSGIAVHYCAEQFENDDSMTSTVFKGMKRVEPPRVYRRLICSNIRRPY